MNKCDFCSYYRGYCTVRDSYGSACNDAIKLFHTYLISRNKSNNTRNYNKNITVRKRK